METRVERREHSARSFEETNLRDMTAKDRADALDLRESEFEQRRRPGRQELMNTVTS